MYDPLTRERFHSMDALRAAMMLLGVLFHCALGYARYTLSTVSAFQDQAPSITLSVFTFTTHLFRMPLFFCVAGFFTHLLYRRYGIKKTMQNRVRRILLPLLASWPVMLATTLPAAAFTYFGGIKGILEIREQLQKGVPLGGQKVTFSSLLLDMGFLHLWFLYFLILFYAALVGMFHLWKALPESGKRKVRQVLKQLTVSPYGLLFWIGGSTLLLYLMPAPTPVRAGIEASQGFVVKGQVVMLYFLFFAYGWLLFKTPAVLKRTADRAWMLVCSGILFAALYAYSIFRGGFLAMPVWQSLLAALSIWSWTLCVLGLFLRYFHTQNRVMQYLTDASYWTYLVHLPFALFLPGLFMGLAMPTILKYLLVVAITLCFCLLTYHYWVRGRRIGAFLGAQTPRTAPKQ